MENASKALYMAAGVLIGIMILSIFIYLFRAGGKVGETYDKRQSQEQLRLFNSNFERFYKTQKQSEEQHTYNTVIDMITVTNLAIDTNEEYEYNSYDTVSIDIILSAEKKLRVSSTEKLERNYLFEGATGTNKIYVYDLLDKKISDIGISTENGEDTLLTVNNQMVYKYIFVCTKMKYHEETGKVNYMEFELMENSNFEETT